MTLAAESLRSNERVKSLVLASNGGRGSCAEACVVNALGGDASKVRFTSAVRPGASGPLDPVLICMICEGTYGRPAFESRPIGFMTDILGFLDR
jgi:hypothetical protein